VALPLEPIAATKTALAPHDRSRRALASEHQEMAIQVTGLVKHYGHTRAVDDLSFGVQRGEVFALLGPNGAGKTTTIEILEGFRARDGGDVAVLGQDPQAPVDLKQRVGLMLQQGVIYPNIQVLEALRLFCSYYARPADPAQLLHLIGLEAQAKARFRTLSGGQKQRLSLGLALAGNPELIFLDEPTAAMDPQARLVTWDLMKDLRQKGVTLLLSTHYLEEAQRLADRVAIIDHGRLVALGTPEELLAQSGKGVVRFIATSGLPAAALRALPGVRTAQEERPGAYVLTGADLDEIVIDVAIWSRAQRLRVTGLRVERATLEEVFLQLTGDGGEGRVDSV